MGVGVSGWALAREVASRQQLGVVSGTALDTILTRRLGMGDPGGHMRRAMARFPIAGVAERVLARYYRERDAAPEESSNSSTASANSRLDSSVLVKTDPARSESRDAPRHRLVPLPCMKLTAARQWLLMLANFVEVYLAKEGHAGVVGVNYLHKIQIPMLPSIYGAMLAGVDVVVMGAGIPGDIPGVLSQLSRNEQGTITLDVLDSGEQKYEQSIDPGALWAASACGPAPLLQRPQFLAIVSSVTLARALLKKAPGGIDGFVVEAPIAGGHNAPPRGLEQLNIRGEPIYGPRDDVDISKLSELGVPYWLAGGYATRGGFERAVAAGARGVQIGTAFAFCEESGLDPSLRQRVLADVLSAHSDVFTDPRASPTGFPFKVVRLSGTLSDAQRYEARPRLCDLGYLRRAYRKPDGSLGYRCPSEPVDDYVRKGGDAHDTIGRKCLCNSLMANIGLGQERSDGYDEPPLLTSGDDVSCLRQFIAPGKLSYFAREVIASVLPPA